MAKVKFGFKNCYYATVTENEGVYTYGTPVRLAGAVSMSLDPSGDTTEFYADDTKYFSDENNNGYEGSLELAMIPDSFKKDILGENEDIAYGIQDNWTAYAGFGMDRTRTRGTDIFGKYTELSEVMWNMQKNETIL